jgi:WD40 repeat protein
MKKLLYLITILVCMQTFRSCIAMEQESKTKPIILQKINGVQQPCCGLFRGNREVIISDGNGCGIYDVMTDNELKKIDAIPLQHIALHPNGNLCALSDSSRIKIYNMVTGIIEKTFYVPDITASIFEPLYDSINILHGNHQHITHCNYRTHRTEYRSHGHSKRAPAIAFHPTQPIMCIAQNKGTILFYDITAGTFNKCLNPPIDRKTWHICDKKHRLCQFNRDGSLLMIGEKHRFYAKSKDGTELDIIFEQQRALHDVIFHKNGKILISLSQPDNELSFWDIPANRSPFPKPIFSMSCSSSKDNPPAERRHMHSYLSCNRSGKDLLVVLSNECLVIPVPFEAIYEPDTKDKCILSYLVLQEYLPKDLLHMFIAKLLKVHKRRLENNTTI